MTTDSPGPRRHGAARGRLQHGRQGDRRLERWGRPAALVLLLAAAACGPTGVAVSPPGTPTPVATTTAPSRTPVATAGEHPPAEFPVMPGAATATLPESDAVAAWTIADAGSAAYDFYRRALPAAGFRILGLYPAELAALIRFEARDGTVWQVIAEQRDGGTRITLRLDRP